MFYDPESLYPRMTIDEAIEKGYLPPDILDGLKTLPDAKLLDAKMMFLSTEAFQDTAISHKLLYMVRTSDITDEEIAEWKEAQEWLDKESIDDKKKRLESIRDGLGFKFEERWDFDKQYEDLAE